MIQKSLIKKGDTVAVLTGKDKGKSGKVLHIDKKNQKAIVDGLNVFKKHVKPSKKYPQGGIIDINSGIKISNLMIICPACKTRARIMMKNVGRDKRRACKKCKEVIQ
jgi:large subunit ribosomal protein L24